MAVAAVALTGCAGVKPWQRQRLASAVMVQATTASPLASAYRSKLIESRTAGGIPGAAAGGGCGCTQ